MHCGDSMAREVIVTADIVKKRKITVQIVKISLLSLLLLLIVLYIILKIIYSEGKFTITLDSNETLESGITIYESQNSPQAHRKLEATPIKFMDNISYKWLPENIDTEAEGAHNGKNYIAYTFYVENRGKDTFNYWYEVILDDVIKNVDEAIRIRIYKNGEATTYAKKNALANAPEEGTTAFKELKDSPATLVLESRLNFNPGDIDRYTIVVWLEGDDPECVDDLIGGEIKMHMNLTEEHIKED